MTANPLPARVEPSASLTAPVSVSTVGAKPVNGIAPVVAGASLLIGETTLDAELAALVEVHRPIELGKQQPTQPTIVLARAETPDPGALNDDELSDVSAGDFKMNLSNFDVLIQNNEAGQFNFDIAQNAFHGAQGVFTTLQTVNSAVDLTVIVNIYLGQQT